MSSVDYSTTDAPSHDDLAIVDEGLGAANEQAAPLGEVRPLACFARSEGRVIAGAIGRTWGPACELQQLWVAPHRRRQGIASRLVREFEAAAARRGCTSVFLETFSFQAPELYLRLGYEVKHELTVYPHGVVRYTLLRELPAADPQAQ
ncbi:putative acetyltransferase [Posidoniimonas corsicana]|uniref:Putative acetyltransferase n=1 Tax=Posidoniimonas corsicana TaxID=1938618 RepID=A0A5C5V3M7_9BACT|nr:GNAT family N-acetyltransferase [Posidoniimonas corsicana]TWT32357.1 putative acetyltransferase [Posidoniimonas corsicana]